MTKRIVAFGTAHALLGTVGWYFVSAAGQGVADGSAEIPVWLTVLHWGVLALLAPLGLIARDFLADFGGFSLGSFSTFGVIVALNSALVASVAHRVAVMFAAWRERRHAAQIHD